MNPTARAEEKLAAHWRDQGWQGFGALAAPTGNLPLKGITIQGRVSGLFYHLKMVQVYYNVFEEPLDCHYIFPLAGTMAVTSFALQVGPEVSRGVLLEREEARETALADSEQGSLSALLEQERTEIFTATVSNLPPSRAVYVAIEVCGQLDFYRDQAFFRFPLVVAPRYAPGLALDGTPVGAGVDLDTIEVPDASRISPPRLLPGCPNSVHLSFQLRIDDAGLGFGAPQSQHEGLVVEKTLDGALEATLKPTVESLPGDLVLTFPLGGRAFHSSLVCSNNAFIVTIVPPDLQQKQIEPLDLMVVLDLNGSPAWVEEQVHSGLARIQAKLGPSDRLGLWVNGETIPLGPPASLSLPKVGLSPGYSGDLGKALTNCLASLEVRPSRRQAILMVTGGLTAQEKSVAQLMKEQGRGVELHALAIGRSPNFAFLQWLCQTNHGAVHPALGEASFQSALDKAVNGLGPVLRDVGLEGLATEAPCGRNLYAGCPGFFVGRYEGYPPSSVTVRGSLVDHSSATQTIPSTAREEPLLPLLWAKAAIARLEGESVVDEQARLQLVELSLQSGLLCTQTAFVAKNDRFRSRLISPRTRVVQPVPQAEEQTDLFADAPSLFDQPSGGRELFGSAPDTSALFAAAEMSLEESSEPELFLGDWEDQGLASGLKDQASLLQETRPAQKAWSPTIEERDEPWTEKTPKPLEEMGWDDLLESEEDQAQPLQAKPTLGRRSGLMRGLISRPGGEPPRLLRRKSTHPEATSRLPLEGRVATLAADKLKRLLDEVDLSELALVLIEAESQLVEKLLAILGPFRGRNLELQMNWASLSRLEERAPARAKLELAVSNLESE